jgi:hypothetical protein
MTEESWARGMADLSVLPSATRGVPPETRGRIYRERLGHLSDGGWLYAVGQALDSEKWFPTVARLLELAAEFVPSPAAKLLGPARSDEVRDLDREEARRGVEMIRAHCPWLTRVEGAGKEFPS